ncbi:MAG: hypothetical protein ACO1RA_02250 [Planctomycetaceae bacterium]
MADLRNRDDAWSVLLRDYVAQLVTPLHEFPVGDMANSVSSFTEFLHTPREDAGNCGVDLC